MRIETHNDTVSFDGGTMSRDEAMQFALDLANAAWRYSDKPETRLAFATVGAVVAMKDIEGALYVYGSNLSNADVNTIRRDRQLARMGSV